MQPYIAKPAKKNHPSRMAGVVSLPHAGLVLDDQVIGAIGKTGDVGVALVVLLGDDKDVMRGLYLKNVLGRTLG